MCMKINSHFSSPTMSSSRSPMVSPVDAIRPSKPRESSCMNISKLVLASLPSVVFGVFTIIFTLQQNYVARENRKQDQKQSDEQSIRSTFENYIDDISARLLDRKFNRSNPEHLLHIRVKTMTVLRHVDVNRKRDIILFLYESRLLRSDLPESERLNLAGADLSDIHFIGSSAAPFLLHHLYLPGVYAPNICFYWSQLDSAVFDDVSMPDAKIIDSTIFNTSFRRIYAPDLTIGDITFYKNDFQGAVLRRMNLISGTDILQTVDFTNADLLGSFTLQQQTINTLMLTHSLIILLNTRLPDGSFSHIDKSNLVIDGGAEERCESKDNQTVWLHLFLPPMEIAHVENDSQIPESLDIGRCSFLARSSGYSLLMQFISVVSFSVLIDNGQAGYNLSAYMGCYGGESNNVTIYIGSLKDNLVWINQYQAISTKYSPRQWNSSIGKLPVKTRVLRLELHASVIDPLAFCLIDNIQLNIVYNRTWLVVIH